MSDRETRERERRWLAGAEPDSERAVAAQARAGILGPARLLLTATLRARVEELQRTRRCALRPLLSTLARAAVLAIANHNPTAYPVFIPTSAVERAWDGLQDLIVRDLGEMIGEPLVPEAVAWMRATITNAIAARPGDVSWASDVAYGMMLDVALGRTASGALSVRQFYRDVAERPDPDGSRDDRATVRASIRAITRRQQTRRQRRALEGH